MAEGIRRDVVLREPAEDLRSMHVSREGVEFYLLVNEGEQTIDTTLTCRSRGRAEWFDAWSGRFEPCETLRADRDGISVRLRLEKHESRVLLRGAEMMPDATHGSPAELAGGAVYYWRCSARSCGRWRFLSRAVARFGCVVTKASASWRRSGRGWTRFPARTTTDASRH